MGFVFALIYIQQVSFDTTAWKSFNGKCAAEKYAMINDLVKRLDGLTKAQVLDLLGPPLNSEVSKYEYCGGPDHKFSLDRPVHMILGFEGESLSLDQQVNSVQLEGPIAQTFRLHSASKTRDIQSPKPQNAEAT